MLGDQNPKAKNSFKSIRKRWKSVTFSEPTYVDYQAHEGDYSSDEEDIEELFGKDVTTQQTDPEKEQIQQEDISDETAKVAPLQTRKESKDETAPEVEEEERRSSEEILDGRAEPRKTSNGTVRDSFFKDDKAETKKLTLTPTLLRDPDTASRPSTDSVGSKDLKARPSLDKMDKELVSDKDSRKKAQSPAPGPQKSKDKKPSAIRNFFSRKDKKRTSEDDDGESFGKRSMDIMDSRDSEEPEEAASPDKAPTRSPSKLQKQQPRTEPSPTRKNSNAANKNPPKTDLSAHFTEPRTNDVSNVPPASMRIVDPETQETKEVSSAQQQRAEPKEEKSGLAKSLLPRSRSGSGSANVSTKPQKTVKAKSRMELDEDSSEAEEALLETPPPAESEKVTEDKSLRPQLPGAFPDSYMTTASDSTVTPAAQQQNRERLSESPVEVSPVSPSAAPGLVADEPSSDGSPSPDLKQEQGWDDTKLRAFFDEGDHVRDLLAVVYDTSNVEPVGADHPIVSGFREQNAKLAEITTVSPPPLRAGITLSFLEKRG